MRFGPVPVGEAAGTILAHSLHLEDGTLRKGSVLEEGDLARIAAAGLREVTVARPGPGDMTEDEAATRLARAILPDPDAAGLSAGRAATGRVNLKAARTGLLGMSEAAVAEVNRAHPEITLATLAPFAPLVPGRIAASVKIISFAVPEAALTAAGRAAREAALTVHPVRIASAGLILTEVPGQRPELAGKGRRAIEARLARLGIAPAGVELCAHRTDAIAAALAGLPGEMALILTGSATSDTSDVAPRAVRRAGGVIERFGLPLDPGNLTFWGRQGGRPVVGLPGSARSPVRGGYDRIVERLACALPPSDAEIAAMGVGGLMKEPPSRPAPREGR